MDQNQQCIQWLKGNKKGSVENVDLLFDGKHDVVVFPNGEKLLSSLHGEMFIILPSREHALNEFQIASLIEEKEQKKPRRRGPAKSFEEVESGGVEMQPLVAETIQAAQVIAPHKPVPFVANLLERSKKETVDISLIYKAKLPSKSFFKMAMESFDEKTLDEILDCVVSEIDQKELLSSIRSWIESTYLKNAS